MRAEPDKMIVKVGVVGEPTRLGVTMPFERRERMTRIAPERQAVRRVEVEVLEVSTRLVGSSDCGAVLRTQDEQTQNEAGTEAGRLGDHRVVPVGRGSHNRQHVSWLVSQARFQSTIESLSIDTDRAMRAYTHEGA